MAYFSIGMELYSERSYEDVLAQQTDGLSWASGWQENYSPPSKSAIFQARARLGSEPAGSDRCRCSVRPTSAITSSTRFGGNTRVRTPTDTRSDRRRFDTGFFPRR